jgi:hypothetical protein
LEELIEEGLLGLEEPLKDEAEAAEEYREAMEEGDIKLIPLEDFE